MLEVDYFLTVASISLNLFAFIYIYIFMYLPKRQHMK